MTCGGYEQVSALLLSHVWYQITNPRGMEGLVDLGRKSELRTWYRVNATIVTSSHCATRVQIASMTSKRISNPAPLLSAVTRSNI